MQINARNVERLKELLKPHRWNGLTNEQKHQLMEQCTEELILKDLRKAYRRVRTAPAACEGQERV